MANDLDPGVFIDADTALPPAQEEAREPSLLATRLNTLKESSFRIAEKREKIPQTLFWSLFKYEIATIKGVKAKQRLIRKLFDGVEP